MQRERHDYLSDIIANVSGGVARGEQASDVQSAHLDLVTLTHLLCDPLNPVITTKDNQSWYLLDKDPISPSMVPVVMSCQQGGQSHLMGSEMGI